MYAIVGSGFGLYGYLPALVEGLGEMVMLPRAWEAKIRTRPELARTLAGIRWVDDAEAALAQASGVAIATPPARQAEVVARCLALPRLKRLVLEKPVAVTPALAADLLARLDAAGKRYRIGYTLLHTVWHRELAWPRAAAPGGAMTLTWTFVADHFAQGLVNWKRFHDQGGGVLRFFGIHVIALLAHHGYDDVRGHSLGGEDVRAPECWRAVFTGPGVPDCHVWVDSRSAQARFELSDEAGCARVRLADPFERERTAAGVDCRVGVLAQMLATFDHDDRPYHAFYARTIALWRKVEGA